MKLIASSFIEEKKSKFYGYLYEINSQDDINNILKEIKEDHKRATHFPYAFILGNTAGKSDDKEPKNVAGLQILNILDRNNLNNHILITVRYYGGKKLGASLLLRTYAKCASLCINN